MANKIIKQSCIQSNRILVHYGVLGMKWGVRKEYEEVKQEQFAINKLNSQRQKDERVIPASNKEHHELINKINNSKYAERYEKIPDPYKYTIEKKYGYPDFKNIYNIDQLFNNLENYLTENNAISSFSELDRLPSDQATMEAVADPELANDLTEEDYKKLNKYLYDADAVISDEDLELLKKYAMNCSNCAAVYELRRRGYDVEAMPYADGITNMYSNYSSPMLGYSDDVSVNFKSGFEWNTFKKSDNFKTQRSEQLAQQILEYSGGKNQRGYVVITGHIFNYEVKNNQVNYIDVQRGGLNSSNTRSAINISLGRIRFARTDNLELDISILSRVRRYSD